MADDIPQWAIERLTNLCGQEDWEKVPVLFTAFARYIAEHEQAPVDPLVPEAERMVAQHWKGEIGNFALAALKRGIELAESGK